MVNDTTVIIGAGLAGAKTAEALRDAGYAGTITLIGAEQHLPYERPALSKDFPAGKKTLADFTVYPRSWYDDHSIDLTLGVTATSIDTAARTVNLSNGTTVPYTSLVLATGSRPVKPSFDGADAAGVHVLRTIDDAQALLAALTEGSRLAVIGGGWIGLEIAAAARARGVGVTVVEASAQPLQAALGAELGSVFAALHTDHGVDLRLDTKVEAITTKKGKATGLRLADGSTISGDAVLIAVGARANIELAAASGIVTDNGGVLVDAELRTSDPNVYAVGDIAAVEHPRYGARVRTEHWANALNQPAVAARAICGGSGVYDRLPYFFTDQYDLGMEFTGRIDGYTRVVYRGDLAKREFLAFWLDAQDRVLAGMNVNIWDATDHIKTLITLGQLVDAGRLADPSVPLGDVIV